MFRTMLCLLSLVAPLAGQVSLRDSTLVFDSVALGSRVRVSLVDGRRLTGRLLTRDTLAFGLHRVGRDSVWSVARANLRAAWLDVGGHARQGARRGAYIGAVVGLVGGCALGLIPEDHVCFYFAAGGVGVGALAGAGVGAVIGGRLRVWRPVRVSARRGGVGLTSG